MSGSLSEARAQRDSARKLVRDDIARLKGDLAEQPIPERVAETAKQEAAELATTTLEVANENRLVIAGTLAALVAWFARRPLIRLANRAGRALPWSRDEGTVARIVRFFQR